MLPDKFTIIVRTNAAKTLLKSFDDEKQAYRMDVKALPEKGKANAEIIKYLSKMLKRKVEITSGLTSKTKKVKVK